MRDHVRVWIDNSMPGRAIRLRWIDPVSGKRRSVSAETTDMAVAEKKRAEVEYEINHGVVTPKRLPWTNFREMFVAEYLPGCRERTIEKYLTVLDSFEKIVNPRMLSHVDERALTTFLVGMRRQPRHGGKVGLAAWTQRNYLVAMKKVVRWAVDQGFMRDMPKFPKVKVPRIRPRAVSTDHFVTMLEACQDDPMMRAFLLCGWMAGLRLNEAFELRRKQTKDKPWVDRENRRIILPAAFVKSGEDQWMPVRDDLMAAFDAVPIDKDYLDRYFPFRSRNKRDRGQLLTSAGVSWRVAYLARSLDLPLTMHVLRKGFGCRLAQQLGKGKAGVLHRLMRHSSMQITMDFYANVDDNLRDSLDELE